MTTYYIKFWETEQLQELGESDTLIETFTDLDEAIRQAQRLVDKHCFSCVEVIEHDTDNIVYGYNGNEFWYGA
jgi:hypothetical protein